MKTGASAFYIPYRIHCLFLLIFLLGAFTMVHGQDTIQGVDSLQTGFELGRLRMENPESIVSRYTYDPESREIRKGSL